MILAFFALNLCNGTEDVIAFDIQGTAYHLSTPRPCQLKFVAPPLMNLDPSISYGATLQTHKFKGEYEYPS